MTKMAEKLAGQMAVHLTPDETVMAVAVVEHRSSAKAMGALGGAVGALVAASMAKPVFGTAGLVPTSGRAVFTLTTQRMLFCKATLRGGVGAPISAIKVASVHGVEATRARLGLGKLHLSFMDGSTISLDLRSEKETDIINQAAAALLRPAPVHEPYQGSYQY